MTSIRSSFNVIGYMGKLLRQSLWLVLVLGLSYLLIGPLPVYLIVSQGLKSIAQLPEGAATTMQMVDNTVHYGGWVSLYIAAIFAGLMLALIFSYYTKSKKQVNFYHSLPVKRHTLLGTHILVAIMIHTLVLFFALLCYLAISHGLLESSMIREGLFLKHFMQIELFFLASFALTLLAGMLTGNPGAQVAMAAVLQLGLLAIAVVLYILCDTSFDTFHSLDLLDNLMHWSLPSLLVMSGLDSGGVFSFTSKELLGLIGVIVLAFALSFILYSRFASERVGDTLTFKGTSLPLKAFFLFTAPLFVGMVTREAGDALLGFIIGFVLAGLLTHILCEMAFQQNVWAGRTKWFSSVVILVAVFAFYLVMDKDLIGFDSYVPDQEQVLAADISLDNLALGSGNRDSESLGIERESITDPDAIQEIIALSEVCANAHREIDENYVTMGAEEKNDANITLIYSLKNGREVAREYHVPREAVMGNYAALYDKDAVQDYLWGHLLKMELGQNLLDLDFTPRSFIGAGTFYNTIYGTHANGTYANGSQDPEVKANMKRLLAAYKQDLGDREYAQVRKSSVVGMMDFYYRSQVPHMTGVPQQYYVYSCDKRTLAVLEDFYQKGIMPSEEAALESVGIAKVQVMERHPEKDTVVQEASDMATIKDWLINRSVSGYTNAFADLEASNYFYVELRDGTTATFDILKDKLPTKEEN